MAKHHDTGIRGELLARQYLEAAGYTILHSNWRYSHKEVDLIATKDTILVFIEIKTRSGVRYGYPEESVTPSKQQHLRVAAEAFLEQYPEFTEVRFDVISILLSGMQATEIMHFRDAF